MNRVDRTTGMVAAAASFTFGYTAASDDYAIAVIAFEEYTYPGPAVINHDLFTRFPADLGLDATTGVRSFSHAGAVDASGAIVIVASYGGTGYTGTAQYGGVSMTLRENYYDSSKTLALRIYTLDDQVSFPTGTQTVTFDGSTTSKLVICATVKCNSGNRARFHTSASKTSASGVTGDAVNLTTTTTTLLYGAGSIPDFSILPDFSAGRGSTAFPGPNTHWVSVDRYSDAVSAGTQAFGYLAPGTSLFGIAAVALEPSPRPRR